MWLSVVGQIRAKNGDYKASRQEQTTGGNTMTCHKPSQRPSQGDINKRRQLSTKKLPLTLVRRFGVVSLCEVARVLNCSRPHIYKLCRIGELRLLTDNDSPDGLTVRVCGLTCITLDSWNAYRERHGIT